MKRVDRREENASLLSFIVECAKKCADMFPLAYCEQRLKAIEVKRVAKTESFLCGSLRIEKRKIEIRLYENRIFELCKERELSQERAEQMILLHEFFHLLEYEKRVDFSKLYVTKGIMKRKYIPEGVIEIVANEYVKTLLDLEEIPF